MRCLLLVSSTFYFASVFVLARSTGELEFTATCTVCSGYHVCRPIYSHAAFECENGRPCTREQHRLCARMLSQEPNRRCDRPGIYPEPGSSTDYFRCKIKTKSLKMTKFPAKCPPSTRFDSLTLRCLTREEKAKLEASKPLTKDTATPPRTFRCRKIGFFPDPDDCKKYHVCDYRLRSVGFYCPFGTYFTHGRCSATKTRRCVQQMIKRAQEELEEGEANYRELVLGEGSGREGENSVVPAPQGVVGKKVKGPGEVSYGIYGVGEMNAPVEESVSQVQEVVEDIIGKYAGAEGAYDLPKLQAAIVNETFRSLSDTRVMEQKFSLNSCGKGLSGGCKIVNKASVAIIVVADCNCKSSSEGTKTAQKNNPTAADAATIYSSTSDDGITTQNQHLKTTLRPVTTAQKTTEDVKPSISASASTKDNTPPTTNPQTESSPAVAPHGKKQKRAHQYYDPLHEKPKFQNISPTEMTSSAADVSHGGSTNSFKANAFPEEASIPSADDIATEETASDYDDVSTEETPSDGDDVSTEETPSDGDDVSTEETPSDGDDSATEETTSQSLNSTTKGTSFYNTTGRTTSQLLNNRTTPPPSGNATGGTTSSKVEKTTEVTTPHEGLTGQEGETTPREYNATTEGTPASIRTDAVTEGESTPFAGPNITLVERESDVTSPAPLRSYSGVANSKVVFSPFGKGNRLASGTDSREAAVSTGKPKRFHCPSAGHFRDPEDCRSFYRCKKVLEKRDSACSDCSAKEWKMKSSRYTCKEGRWFSNASSRCVKSKPSEC